jgi:phospholipid transport system substrate-binding protein
MSLAVSEKPLFQRCLQEEDMTLRTFVPIFSVLLIMGMSAMAHSTEPLDALRGPVEQVLSILKDSRDQNGDSKSVKRGKIRDITRKIFDYTEMSKRALARNWRNFTPRERKEFRDVFAELLENTYIDKIQGEYQDEKVIYLSQELVTAEKALVKTKILRENIDIPVNYSMLMRNETWWIYDVNIEGVSLVKNYRTQFNEILLKESPAQLIERLKKKITQQEK